MPRHGGKSERRTGSRFEYRPISKDDVKRRKSERGGTSFESMFKPGIDTYTPQDGKNRVRILPKAWDDDQGNHYGYRAFVHYGIGANNSRYLCPKEMLNKPCPICEAAREYHRSGEKEEAKQLWPKTRSIMWVIDRDDTESKEPVPRLWDAGRYVDEDILEATTDEDHPHAVNGVVQITEPNNGFDVTFKRSGEGVNTRYSNIRLAYEPENIDDDIRVQEDILDFIADNPIPDLLVIKDYDYLDGVFSGTEREPDADLDERSTYERGRSERDSDRDGRSSRGGRDTDSPREGREGTGRDRGERDRGGRTRDEDERGGGRSERRAAIPDDDKGNGDPEPEAENGDGETTERESDRGGRGSRDAREGAREGRDRSDDRGRGSREGRGREDTGRDAGKGGQEPEPETRAGRERVREEPEGRSRDRGQGREEARGGRREASEPRDTGRGRERVSDRPGRRDEGRGSGRAAERPGRGGKDRDEGRGKPKGASRRR